MKRLVATGIVVAAALALSACGSSGGSSSSGSGSAAGSSSAGSKTVSVRQLSGVGSVLVDHSGMALYTPDQEAGGKIVCAGACTSFWMPLAPGGATPTAAPGTGKLGTIKRPDGTTQVTVNGKPVYTFSEDSPGKATGDGFSDDFGGHHFTWHAVRAGKAAPPATGGGSGTNPGSSQGSGGGYKY